MSLNQLMVKFKKTLRFLRIYGPGRTLLKVLGRTRFPIPLAFRRHSSPDIAMVGCGQFGFATIGYFITRQFGRRFLWCFDTDQNASRSFERVFQVSNVAQTVDQILTDPATKTVYIASNHYSHSDYAIAALAAGKDVYIEKPIAVTRKQLVRICAVAEGSDGRIFAGYNRPFSRAILSLSSHFDKNSGGGISLQCFVSGHVIGPDHWYRKPEEGTRICGNAGHWIDLFIHMLGWRRQAGIFHIMLLPADSEEPDDNFSLSIATDQNDIFSLMLSARSEPFEGINETINFQHRDIICKIDDFRNMTLWKKDCFFKKNFWPKDVGHKLAILQPFQTRVTRDWDEVVRSTLLMLHITDMVTKGITESTFSMEVEMNQLKEVVKTA